MMPIQIVLFIFLQVLSFSYSNSKLTIETVDPLQDKMVGLWSTPILKRTLLSKEKQVINMELKQLILQSFQEFQETG
jgi:hypothetical protein